MGTVLIRVGLGFTGMLLYDGKGTLMVLPTLLHVKPTCS